MREAGLYLGESLGFRAWRIGPAGLTSLNQDYEWEPGENRARCLRAGAGLWRRLDPHPAELVPAEGCSCGIFAYSELDMAGYHGRMVGGQILGAVAGWGQLRVHRHGFRAQRARIIALLVPPWGLSGPAARELERLAGELAERYSVPLFGGHQVPAFLDYCAAQEQVEPIPEAERPARWASIRRSVAGLAAWTALAIVHARSGLSSEGTESLLGEPTSLGFMVALALAAAATAAFGCWRALREAEELHFFNLLERIGRIDRSQPRPRIRARVRRS